MPVSDPTRGEEVKIFVVLQPGLSREDVSPQRIFSPLRGKPRPIQGSALRRVHGATSENGVGEDCETPPCRRAANRRGDVRPRRSTVAMRCGLCARYNPDADRATRPR